jgi:hypothetical protein
MTKLLVFLLTIGFLAVSGWDTWEAVGNLLGLPGFYEALNISDSTPWVLLVAGVATPWVAVAGGLLWARGRGVLSRTLIYLIALAASSAVSLSLLAAEQAWRASVLLSSLG